MMKLWLLLHWAGIILWLGPGVAGMLLSIRARRESDQVRATVARLLAPIHSTLIGPGALIAAGTGVVLTMRLARIGAGASSPGLMVMQGAGLLGALIVIGLALPAAGRLARVASQAEGGGLPPAFHALRKRLVIASSTGSTLGIIALLAAVLG